MNSTSIDKPKTIEALTLFLYSPIPGYATVCFDNHPTRTSPSCFRKVADDLGDERQRLDIKFLLCLDSPHVNFSSIYKISSCPTCVVFKCGSDFKELGRMTASRDYNHTQQLDRFVVNTKTGHEKTGETSLALKLRHEKAKSKVKECFEFMNHKYGINLQLDEQGCGSISICGFTCSIDTCKSGLCRIISYIHDEEHGGDAELLAEVLCWNFSGDFPTGLIIGVERSTSKFTMECVIDILEEGKWNVVGFDNMICNIGNALEECKHKIDDFKQRKHEDLLNDYEENQQEVIPCRGNLRLKRSSKFFSDDEDMRSKSKQRNRIKCECCRKFFQSQGSLTNHLQSKKHKQRLIRYESNLVEVKETGTEKPAQKRDEAEKKKIVKYRISQERKEFRYHRKILRAQILQDKEERRQNGGKLKTKLGVDGFRPTGTVYFTESDEGIAYNLCATKGTARHDVKRQRW